MISCADGFADYFITQPSMRYYWTNGPIFDHFSDAIKAIDTTFQHSYARVKDYATKNCWLGKHKGYGWKSEVSVGMDGKACYVSPHIQDCSMT